VSRSAGGPAHPRYRPLALDLSDLDAIAPAIGEMTRPPAAMRGTRRSARRLAASTWSRHIAAPSSGGSSAGRGAYAASKAALVGLARSWAAEQMPRGITVNARGICSAAQERASPTRAAFEAA
jgi:3-oxoacyl-[acyl-carrier protein] reductase